MIPTDQPSGSTQMVRISLPPTLMAPDIAAIHRKARHSPQWERGDREASGRAHAGRLRSGIQQPRPRARASRNLRALDARGGGLPGRSDEGTARRARIELRIVAASIHRPVFTAPRDDCAACAVHPWRLLALARSFPVQPYGARAQCPWRGGRRRRLRSLSGGDHRRHYRPDPARMFVSVAAHGGAHADLRPLGGRTPRRRNGGDRLAVALSESAGRSRASRLLDLRTFRSHPARRHSNGAGSASRRGRGAPCFDRCSGRHRKGHVFDALAGALESSEFLRQSRTVADSWGKAGAQTRYEAAAGMNHFTVIDALADPQSAMVRRLVALAPRHK